MSKMTKLNQKYEKSYEICANEENQCKIRLKATVVVRDRNSRRK